MAGKQSPGPPAAEFCEWGWLPVDECYHCCGPQYGRWATARCGTVCIACPAVIQPGDPVREDGHGNLLCAGCGED